jgi:hypothetical protein
MGPGGKWGGVVDYSDIHLVAFILFFAKDKTLQLRDSQWRVGEKKRKIEYEQQHEQSGQSIRIIYAEITNQFVMIRFGRKID